MYAHANFSELAVLFHYIGICGHCLAIFFVSTQLRGNWKNYPYIIWHLDRPHNAPLASFQDTRTKIWTRKHLCNHCTSFKTTVWKRTMSAFFHCDKKARCKWGWTFVQVLANCNSVRLKFFVLNLLFWSWTELFAKILMFCRLNGWRNLAKESRSIILSDTAV